MQKKINYSITIQFKCSLKVKDNTIKNAEDGATNVALGMDSLT